MITRTHRRSALLALVVMSLLLALVAFVAGREMFGAPAGLIALALLARRR